jgi:vancomycin permeability regulator SanA
MKLKSVLLYILLLTSLILKAQTQFGSAEERIVYNKRLGLPKYEGVNIEYSYAIRFPQTTTEADIQKIKAYFNSVIKSRIEIENNKTYLFLLTEGDRNNHEKYNEALIQNPQLIEKGKRKYILK